MKILTISLRMSSYFPVIDLRARTARMRLGGPSNMFRKLSTLAMILLLAGPWSIGQSTFGSIRGTTLDQTGSSIPDAQLILHSADENTDFPATSDEHGNFAFENIK